MINLLRTSRIRLGFATALAGGALIAGGAVAVPAASAQPAAGAAPAVSAAAPAAKSAVVVKERVRPHVGKILVTTTGRALYYLPKGSCTGQCLAIWPRLVMPAGKTKPKGANCLGTMAFGTKHRLQVTYRKHRVYTFVDDMGTSVTGNNVAGFKVVKIAAHC
jgi:predicted lipoprotein with Yx(FWY)xxD motif